MHRFLHRFFRITSIISTLIIVVCSPAKPSRAQTNGNDSFASEQAIAILENLTPEERVGQLFLLTFEGNNIEAGSQIANLISNHHIGGVVLSAQNDNFAPQGITGQQTISQTMVMNEQLQQFEWESSLQDQVNPGSGESFQPAFIPLFIGISQEGDGYPYDQILHGLTPLANPMALGAAWEPQLAEQTGNILGQELTALGINLLLGPSLDVLETPQLEGSKDLGTRAFGGDPFWVGEMGRAYIRGVHSGSQNKVAVVAKHFPGHGSSDRLPEEEVATVRKSLEELESFDLVPFFAVTGSATAPQEISDALLTSNIRYQGLQGNIRATTRPVSFDPQAINLLLQIPALDSWRQNGGVMISDNLGSQAVRQFYELTSQSFDARRVTLNAFLAGNDLLYIADLTTNNETDPEAATIHTLEFFAQKYREDAAFAQRVDESVVRILTLKYRMFENFSIARTLPNQDALEQLGQSSQVSFDVARQAATLISPTLAELDETIPDPPNQNDRIIFLSDARTAQQCSACPPQALMETRALQDATLRLYGPQAGGQVQTYNLSSYSLTDLQALLNNELEEPTLENDLKRANWIVFAMLPADSSLASFNTLTRFLSERPDLFQQKRLIVFSFSAPYYLDATNISKLTAYYGLYGKSPQFIDVAAYLLFGELRPSGASPVSIAGIGYDLNEALFPDPGQTILLELDLPQTDDLIPTLTPQATPTVEYHLGEVVQLRTGVILDHNGNPVPDGTPVHFTFNTTGELSISSIQEATTQQGIARTTYAVSSPGTLEIIADSEAARSNSLKFDIPAPSGEITTATPTEPPPTVMPTPTPVEATPQPTEIPVPTVEGPTSPNPELSDWIMAVLIASIMAWSSYRLAALVGHVRWGVRAGFLALIGGLLGFCYLALEMPGSEILLQNSIPLGVVIASVGGVLLGLLITLLWRALSLAEKRQET
ncbi:glycoside hydrolase family 3 N-terminal domain-containing protein [Chloroflexota bacterium]